MKIFLHTGRTVRLIETPRQRTTDGKPPIRGRWRDSAQPLKIPR